MAKKIKDELNPVKVGPNRYKLSDGRVVSRQRIEQIRHPDRLSRRILRYKHRKGLSTKYYKSKYNPEGKAIHIEEGED